MKEQTFPQADHPPRSSSLYPEDISPPDTPRTNGDPHNRSRTSSPNVSPISDTPSPLAGRSFKSHRYSSNLPVPKKNTKKFWKLPSPNGDSQTQEPTIVRWDEYSGEPTDSEKGKPPSTTPGAVRSHEDPTSPGRLNSNFGTSTHISGGTVPARKRVGNRDISDTPIIMRPEWRGAGGRQVIVKPLTDKPLPPGKSPNYPIGSHKLQLEQMERDKEAQDRQDRKRAEQERDDQERRLKVQEERARLEKEQVQMAQEREAKHQEKQERHDRERADQEARVREDASQPRRERDKLQQDRQQSPGSSPELSTSGQKTVLQPAVKLNDHSSDRPSGRPSPGVEGHSVVSTPTMTPSDAGLRNANLTPADTRSPLARNPSNEEMKVRRAQALPELPKSADEEKPNPRTPVLDEKSWQVFPESMPRDRPIVPDSNLIESRFRADLQQMHLQDEPSSRFSTTTYATTVCDSPPLTPEMGSHPASNSTTPSSILNRKRPVQPAGILNAKATARKPTPSETPTSTPNSQNQRHSKSLPKPPADAQVVSPVQTLQAKQDVLRRRRRNLETVIHELTHVVQPSSVAYDMASRQEIKKTVEGLNKELAEVAKDEHETGLKLHRAWKRHEDYAQFEPTSFWVRRVTS